MPFHHQGTVTRRLVPARIPREISPPILATFDTEITHEQVPAAGPVVGVIDTGVVVGANGPHPFLQLHLVEGFDNDVDVKDRLDPADSYGHGTFVAGVILREEPTVRISMKAALDAATGKWEDEAVAAAITELGEAGVTLINLSFSGDLAEEQTPDVIVRALEGLGPSVVVVAAAGNNSSSRPVYPAAVKSDGLDAQVVAVGAVDTSQPGDTPPVASFSGWGEWVHVYANGRHVFGPLQDDGWILWSGTSFACATVTGRIAAAMVRDASTAQEAASKVLKGDGSKIIDDDNNHRPYVASKAAPVTIKSTSIPN